MSCYFCVSWNSNKQVCQAGPSPLPTTNSYTCRSFILRHDRRGQSMMDQTRKSHIFWRQTAEERLRKMKKLQDDNQSMREELVRLKEEVASLSGTLDSPHLRERDVKPFVVSTFQLISFVEKESWSTEGHIVDVIKAAQFARQFINGCLPPNRLSNLEELCLRK